MTPDHKVCSLVEYIGTITNEIDRQAAIRENPSSCQYYSFKFDYVYEDTSSQEFVYENTAKSAMISAFEGYNATIFAYGQTGTGKTYTMEGFQFSEKAADRGIIPRCVDDLFKCIEQCPNKEVIVECI